MIIQNSTDEAESLSLKNEETDLRDLRWSSKAVVGLFKGDLEDCFLDDEVFSCVDISDFCLIDDLFTNEWFDSLGDKLESE